MLKTLITMSMVFGLLVAEPAAKLTAPSYDVSFRLCYKTLAVTISIAKGEVTNTNTMSLSIQTTNFPSAYYDSCTICYTQLWNISISFISIASEFQHCESLVEKSECLGSNLDKTCNYFWFIYYYLFILDFRIHWLFLIVVGCAESFKD